MEYSYSFSNELEQQWKWTERYAAQPEILRYINHAADRFDLRSHVQLDTRVLSAEFDLQANCWTVITDQGDTVQARFCIMATGCLSAAKMPDFKGLASFKGNGYHTGLWSSSGADLTGKRVGVIGTGSSGIQSIPQIAKQAKHLYVFQRTPHFSLPARNHFMSTEYEARFKTQYADRRKIARESTSGVAGYPIPSQSALDVTDEERDSSFQMYWDAGRTSFMRAYTDLLRNQDSNATAASFVREKICQTVHNPAVANLLTPKEHFIGTKRICLDSDYYETFNRDNVTLVDVISTLTR